MPTLHQFDYIFAIGLIFAFLDAWNIGANDVANSFATSVSSRSLTMKQAMMIASVMEFAGALGVGARVADTIRSKILSTAAFEAEPSILMLGMTCALVSSSVYMTMATRLGMPVSTTHSIIGGVMGVGIAALGVDGVNWGWNGVSQVFAAWAIAPGLAGCFGAIIFLATKYGVMKRKNPVRAAFIMIPVYFTLTSGILTMLIVWKGAASASANVKTWGAGEYVGVILGTALGVGLLSVIFLLPWLHRKLIMDDWEMRWYHIFQGPLLLRRGPVPPNTSGTEIVQNYYEGHKTREELDQEGSSIPHPATDIETNNSDEIKNKEAAEGITSERTSGETPKTTGLSNVNPAPMVGKWYEPKNLFETAKRAFFHGVEVDVIAEQQKASILAGNIEEMHARAMHYDNKAEHAYSFLQVLTAATASFAHGANDVSNAIGPLAAIYLIWSTGKLSSKSPVPIWVLVYGGAALVIGLWTYGYNIMRNLGNRLTLHSPSRGFSMELGSAITVVMATRLALPISTTQCIVGSTVGVGLCNGDVKSINWRMVVWIYLGWIITLPVTGIIAGCLMGIIINAPRWGMAL
ncbi:Phosphate transporter [Venustampulla echinocandica]|uniref:Phosphate transporter n=1 Tax=Venustampulla echinocandica TaxID=2656787 RepID=A0A370TNN5_9HELO|nr:Phosphate transporter [Venustampulla echinocandica]RDL37135.1 Phosphate transporter [Venustampulla echinocandica]